jgi:hypothetical protein
MLSTILRIWNLVRPWKRYARTRARFWGGALSWEYCKYSRAHCWMRVDISAHVKLRNRLRNMRMFIRIESAEALKEPWAGRMADDEVEGAFDCDWATS